MSRPATTGNPRTDEFTRELEKRELETIIMVSTLLNSAALNLRSVLMHSMQAIVEAFEAEAGSIFLLDEERDELELHVPTGDKGEQLRGIRIPRDHGLVGWVVTNGKPLVIEDASKDERFVGQLDKSTGFVTSSVLAVPLKVKGRVIGALECLNKVKAGSSFSRREIPFLGALANQVALAIENARLYSALEEAFEETKRLDELKTDFINVSAHELLTPVTVLSGHAEMLERELAGETANPDLVEALDGIQNGISRLNKLSKDLVNMVLIDEQRVELEIEDVNLAHIVQSVVQEVGGFARRRKQELFYDTDLEASSMIVRGDQGRLTHVLHNLVMNAVRFTPDGGEIVVRADSNATEVVVSVLDTGIGIREEEQAHIFDKLYAIQSAKHHTSGTYEFMSGGLGLGLAIAKGIVIAHGGRIWVESEPSQGSVFSFSIPRSQGD